MIKIFVSDFDVKHANHKGHWDCPCCFRKMEITHSVAQRDGRVYDCLCLFCPKCPLCSSPIKRVRDSHGTIESCINNSNAVPCPYEKVDGKIDMFLSGGEYKLEMGTKPNDWNLFMVGDKEMIQAAISAVQSEDNVVDWRVSQNGLPIAASKKLEHVPLAVKHKFNFEIEENTSVLKDSMKASEKMLIQLADKKMKEILEMMLLGGTK